MAKSRSHHRPALIALVLVSAVACLALGWWQWERFEAVGGDGQNLGYAFQWPLFAAFVIYAYRKFVQLEGDAEASEANGDEPADETVREIPADLLPKRPVYADTDDLDDVEARQLLEYNSYLAELDRSRE
ncbi:MAG: transcriptional regulator [Rhodococcus sp. (in: high G+C Gram-positive bacteria)]|uniref:transcriptional regulator n=1 Tax=Rhodococcus sp. EPR-157 TaxID=1813677 RepID=UPI0007BB8C48|nr:transcriptional regulator [Rhodococcus sp. EPR-157]KZF02923.1 transcriptional regulator [Rhodococcus sp. EPR-157]